MAVISITGAGTAAANQLYTLGLVGRYTASNGYYLDPLGFSGYGIYDNTDLLLYSSGAGVLGPYSAVTGVPPAPTATAQTETTTVVTFAQSLLSEGGCVACFGMSIADILGLTLLTQIAASGGGGGQACCTTYGNYNGGPPTFTPTTATAEAVDKDTDTEWKYYDGSWH